MKKEMTKIEKAQIIIQVLYDLKNIPQKDNIHVKRYAKLNIELLDYAYKRAYRKQAKLPKTVD